MELSVKFQEKAEPIGSYSKLALFNIMTLSVLMDLFFVIDIISAQISVGNT
jgi:hypothetical protein